MEKRPQQNDEVDVFELFGYIKKGFNRIGNALLRFFNFLMRNIIILAILIVVGVVAGYFIGKNTPDAYKTEAIVVSNFESAEYLYKSIREINSKLSDPKPAFLKEFGLTEKVAGKLSLEIEPIIRINYIGEGQINYLELLNENELLTEEQWKKIIENDYEQHKITLFHTTEVNSGELLSNILTHIRDNQHYQEVYRMSNRYIESQINSNLFVLAQIDSLLQNYAASFSDKTAGKSELLFSEKSMNMGALLESRTNLQTRTRDLIAEKVENTAFLKIIDVGAYQELEDKTIFSAYIILLPLLLVGVFFLIHILIALNTKAKNYKKTHS